MNVSAIVTALAVCVLLSGTLAADELDDALSGFDDFDEVSVDPGIEASDSDMEDFDESGFDDMGIAASDPGPADVEPVWYSVGGRLSAQGAFNYAQNSQSIAAAGDTSMDFSDLSRSRFKGALSLDMKHGDNWRSRIDLVGWYDLSWTINGRENYIADVLDTYESFVDIKDAYIQGSLTPNLDLKFGRQVVIWGKSDSIRITDVINPLDNREPGMVDIEDLRLSEVMTRLDYYFGDWGLSSIVIHEPRLEIESAFGSDYRPSDIFGEPIQYALFPDRVEPTWSLGNTQYAMSLDGHFSGWDISCYAAHVYDSRFGIETSNSTPLRTYDMIDMVGIASNLVSGSWLFKAEGALIRDIKYRSTGRKSRLDALIGFDYMGISNTVISLEVANRHIFDYEEKMLSLTLQEAVAQNTFPDFVRRNSVQVALRTSVNFDHDNATVTYLLSLSGGSGPGGNIDGGFHRLWIDYKYSDAVSLNGGVVAYIGGDGIVPFFKAIEENDRVFAEIRYDF